MAGEVMLIMIPGVLVGAGDGMLVSVTMIRGMHGDMVLVGGMVLAGTPVGDPDGCGGLYGAHIDMQTALQVETDAQGLMTDGLPLHVPVVAIMPEEVRTVLVTDITEFPKHLEQPLLPETTIGSITARLTPVLCLPEEVYPLGTEDTLSIVRVTE